MPNPIDVNPNNYKVKKILFDNGEFAIAIGRWFDTENTLAMRWNGDDNNDKGYPKTFGNPMWFIIHNDLKQSIIQSLMINDEKLINKLL